MDMGSTQYRNLADWSLTEWKSLDIHLFIANNFTRYCSLLLKKVGLQYLPSDASDSLLGLFCDVAYKPLKSVHQKSLHVVGDRRNQIMLGTLKMITFTRMVEALIQEYPNYIALEQLPEAGEDEFTDEVEIPASLAGAAWYFSGAPKSQPAFYAAETSDFSYDLIEQEETTEEDQVSQMVEALRAHLTPVQYRHIRYAVCDGLNSQEIADRTGHSVTNVRIMLLNARKRMMQLVPPHLVDSMQDCLYRR